jgi:hypothetical protein
MGTADGVVPPDWPGPVQAAGLLVARRCGSIPPFSAVDRDALAISRRPTFAAMSGHLVENVLDDAKTSSTMR